MICKIACIYSIDDCQAKLDRSFKITIQCILKENWLQIFGEERALFVCFSSLYYAINKQLAGFFYNEFLHTILKDQNGNDSDLCWLVIMFEFSVRFTESLRPNFSSQSPKSRNFFYPQGNANCLLRTHMYSFLIQKTHSWIHSTQGC